MARSRYKIHENQQPYFLTCTVVNWLPIFGSPMVTHILLDSLQFLQQQNRLTIYAYIIMENHLHCIASSLDLSKEVGDFKSFTARKILDFFTEKHAHHVLKLLEDSKIEHK